MPASKTQLIREFVQRLGGSFGAERSFKLQPGRILSDRLLYSFEAAALGKSPLATLEPLLGALDFPVAEHSALRERLQQAVLIHLGYEPDTAPGGVCKIYCEYADGPIDDTGAQLVHRALKWSDNTDRCVEGLYRHYPGLDYSAVKGRIEAIAPELLPLMLPLLQQLEAQLPCEALFYQEVEDLGSPRRSFDLKLYPLDWSLAELGDWLGAVRQQFGLAPLRWHSLWGALRQRHLGHLTGGIARDGQPFFTLYYDGAWYRPASACGGQK